MRAVVLSEYGDESVLVIRDVPDPVPGPDEVVVSTRAVGLNRADLLQRMGLYPGPSMPFEIPGLEFAGTVVAVGQRVEAVSVGAPVMGIVAGGSYAEMVVTHERMLLDVPDTIAPADAAAIPEAFITAFDALVVQGGLRSGGTALVHAGASGVGTAAIQIAAAIGARVVVTASGAKLEACRGLGADLAIDSADDFVARVKEMTGAVGVDVVLDVVGGDYVDRNIACLAVGGRIIQVGVMGGGRAQVSVGALLMKRAQLIGTTLRSRPLEEKISITRRFAREMLPLFDRGELHPVIDSRFDFDDVAAAHRRMASNANIGKILLDLST